LISITDGDVERVARLLELSLDPESIAFLKRTSTCDLHACPGSGKTTLLVAKLAIHVRAWPWRDRGVLVLSHTNVARHEVESRLAHDATGSRLLRYPHFIGTGKCQGCCRVWSPCSGFKKTVAIGVQFRI
jgi:hypothetical protein